MPEEHLFSFPSKRKYFRCLMIQWSIFFVFLFATTAIFCVDWNAQFDEETKSMMRAIPLFQNVRYAESYAHFQKARSILLHDPSFQSKRAAMSSSSRMRFISKEAEGIVKKRGENIKELYTWELSFLLGSGEYFVPSLPIECDGTYMIIQPIESFCIMRSHIMPKSAKECVEKVPLETYWKAHLQAYLLGIQDLYGRNIGVSSEGIIRFFDTEYSFQYFETGKMNVGCSVGFISQSFDWPHFHVPLDQASLKSVQNFLQSLSVFEELYACYKRYRHFSFQDNGLFRRLQKIRTVPLKVGMTFSDLYAFLFPSISEGLDPLMQIAEKLMKRPVREGTALLFLCGKILNMHALSREGQERLQHWVETYADGGDHCNRNMQEGIH